MKRRSKHEIIHYILERCREPQPISYLMRGLSYNQLDRYLKFMRESGLVSRLKNPHGKAILHKTTEKGLRYIKVFNELQEMLVKEELK